MDRSQKFLNLSGGALALAVAGLILLPFLCCVGSLFFCGAAGVLGSILPTPEATP